MVTAQFLQSLQQSEAMSSPATIKGLLVLRVTGGNPLLGVIPRVSGVGVTADTLVVWGRYRHCNDAVSAAWSMSETSYCLSCASSDALSAAFWAAWVILHAASAIVLADSCALVSSWFCAAYKATMQALCANWMSSTISFMSKIFCKYSSFN